MDKEREGWIDPAQIDDSDEAANGKHGLAGCEEVGGEGIADWVLQSRLVHKVEDGVGCHCHLSADVACLSVSSSQCTHRTRQRCPK